MNILVTNYLETGDNVMIFAEDSTGIGATSVAKALTAKGLSFTDCFEVPDNERRYYLYEPLWADERFIQGVKRICAQA